MIVEHIVQRLRAGFAQSGLRDGVKMVRTQAFLLGEYAQFTLQQRPDASAALVILAPGRTGSSWLQEVLSKTSGLQAIHEPLSARHIPRVAKLTGKCDPPGYISSFYLRPDCKNADWQAVMEDILQGKIRTPWTNPKMGYVFPKGFLVKMIRSNLMSGFLAENFAPRIVALERHPGAVLASRLQAGWTASVEDILGQPDLIEDHLADHVDAIAAHVGDPVAALAIWYAVEIAVCRRQLADFPHVRVRYESIAMHPEVTLAKLADDLNLPTMRLDLSELAKASRMARGRPDYSTDPAQIEARLSSWRSRLSYTHTALAQDWCARLGVGDICDDAPSARATAGIV